MFIPITKITPLVKKLKGGNKNINRMVGSAVFRIREEYEKPNNAKLNLNPRNAVTNCTIHTNALMHSSFLIN
jgi:hypothetical protein